MTNDGKNCTRSLPVLAVHHNHFLSDKSLRHPPSFRVIAKMFHVNTCRNTFSSFLFGERGEGRGGVKVGGRIVHINTVISVYIHTKYLVPCAVGPNLSGVEYFFAARLQRVMKPIGGVRGKSSRAWRQPIHCPPSGCSRRRVSS